VNVAPLVSPLNVPVTLPAVMIVNTVPSAGV